MIDTNVLVSALLARHEDAATLTVVKLVLNGGIIPLYDMDILSEYHQVLRRAKFSFPQNGVQVLLEAIAQRGEWVDRLFSDAILPDPKDLAFYEVALARQNENAFLIAGNKKHFPAVSFVVTSNEMLDIMRTSKDLSRDDS